MLVDDLIDGAYVCRSEFESPDVDGEIIVSIQPGMKDPGSLVGKFVEVEITGAGDYDLSAKLTGI